jgi:hypothetical protein
VTDPSNVTSDLARLGWLKDPGSQLDLDAIVSSIKNIDPIVYQYYFNIFLGKTKEGSVCYFPDSYRKGYQDFLDGQKLVLELELFAVGQSENGDWVFLPSYLQGVNAARNELKIALLAEMQRRLFDETVKAGEEAEKQSKSIENVASETTRNKDAIGILQDGYENLLAENQKLKDIAEAQMKLVDEHKNETEKLRVQLQEVKNMLQGEKSKKISSSSNDTFGSDSRGVRRKGAAPISY